MVSVVESFDSTSFVAFEPLEEHGVPLLCFNVSYSTCTISSSIVDPENFVVS